MPNGWSRPEANTSLLLGLAAPSAARRTRIRPGSDSAMKMSTFGPAETGLAITRAGFDADRVAYGGGRSVILRRTKGASVRQSPNAALPANSSPRESEARCAKTAGAKDSTQVASAAVTAQAMMPRGLFGHLHPKAPLRSVLVTGMAAMNCLAVSI